MAKFFMTKFFNKWRSFSINDDVFHGLMQMIKLIYALTAELSIFWQLVNFLTGHEVNGIEA